jgi:hypothetical protein
MEAQKKMDLQRIIIDIFGTGITYFASAIVWLTLVAGLFQLIRAGVQHIGAAVADARSTLPAPRHYLRTTASDQSGELTQHV